MATPITPNHLAARFKSALRSKLPQEKATMAANKNASQDNKNTRQDDNGMEAGDDESVEGKGDKDMNVE